MISRMILDIESYLTSPMTDPGDHREMKERIFLGHLLAYLIAEREAMGVDR
jgi:hypothetical protein